MTNAVPEQDHDRLVARKNQKLGLILALIVCGATVLAYLTRFTLWHVVFAQ